MSYSDISKTLVYYGQSHLLDHYSSLSFEEQAELLNQLTKIDFSLLNHLTEQLSLQSSSGRDSFLRGKFTPIQTLTLQDIEKNKDRYYQHGIDTLHQGLVAAVLLAGGQGTRLGFDRPKGTLNIGVTKDIYLFELLIHSLNTTAVEAGAWINLYIMTSEKNNDETIDFFKDHSYFGYNPDYITFFTQELAPSVDYIGKIYMEDKVTPSLSPNGNGGWFSSLIKAGLLSKIKASGIQWLNVFSVDNVLQKICDPYFIGATLTANCVSGAKVVKKASPEERVGVLCLEDGKPSVVEYYEATEEMKTAKDLQGNLLYNYGVILNYLFNMTELEKIQNTSLPIHIVEKKIPYLDTDGQFIVPQAPNGYKFETLLLDMVHMLDTCLPYEVQRSHEFAPIKNATGVDALDSARALLIKNGIKL